VKTLATLGYTLSGADSTVTLQQNKFEYTVSIAPETVAIPQLALTGIQSTDANATVQLIRTPLQINDTVIIRVVAENKTDSADYTIAFTRIKSPYARLSGLSYNGTPITNFHPDTLDYTVILPWEDTQIPVVTASRQWDSSTVNITQPSSVFGLAYIQVIPENKSAGKMYTISFKRGSNAALAGLTWSLDNIAYSPVDNFSATDTAYHVSLPIGTTSLPVLNYVLVDTNKNTKATVTNVTQPNGIAKVEIMGWDSLNSKTYTVEFKVELSKEAALSDLTVDGVTVDGFHTDTLNYFIEYEYGTITLPVIAATATQPDAKIDYTPISEYPAVAVIKVYAGDTTVHREYTISFSLEAGDNAFLSNLLIDSVSLPAFSKDSFFYHVLLPYGTTALPVVSATTEDERATVTITQIAQFSDTAKIQVEALNGHINEYRLCFTIDGNSNAYAANIFIDGVRLENFNRTSRNYNPVLPANYSGIPVVTAELEDANATYIVKDAEQIPGQTVIEVTAENKRDKFSYRLNFTKGTLVASVENHTKVSIYPNPAADNINFVLEGVVGTVNLEISTVEGKILARYALQEGTNPVKIDHLPDGVYFYKVYTLKGVLGTGKFIKQ
jgi:hypothetical protein